MMPESAVIIEACVECHQDLEHCHGTAIVHVDGMAECSDDPDCRVGPELHLFLLSCYEVECACGAGRAGPALAGEAAAS